MCWAQVLVNMAAQLSRVQQQQQQRQQKASFKVSEFAYEHSADWSQTKRKEKGEKRPLNCFFIAHRFKFVEQKHQMIVQGAPFIFYDVN